MAITGTNPVGPAAVTAGIYNTTPPTLSDGNHQTLTLDSGGRLRVVQDSAPADTEVTGEIAHDAADSGNPVKVGGKATAAIPTSVTEADRVNASFDLGGRQRVIASGEEAHDAADAGAPVKVGGKATAATATAVAEADRVNASFTLEGRLRTISEGHEAHDAADAGNPLKIGGKAITGSNSTAVSATSDRVNAHFDVYGRQVVRPSGTWQVQHTPAANTQATISQAAGAAGVKNVCTSITVTFSGNASSAAAVGTVFNLRDGVSGAGTILWSGTIWITATAGDSESITLGPIWIEGPTAATAMTLEAAAAGGANTVQSVSMTGTVTQ